MGGHKEKSHLDILLDNTQLVLRGIGVDVEPVRLAGTLVLHLAEDTSIRELTLQFRGKAKIPMPATESLVGSATSITYVVCNHDWSFLKGDDRHTKTLKAGRHAFPFHLDITGSLPSTVFTDAFGGASVSYKLRASAVRPGLNHNLNTTVPITIMRSLTNEALEFQQSLEIENTWKGKLMYAIILPHKAWAAGDMISAILKFSPLAKGVAIDHVVTTLCETTKIYARSGTQEDTRILSTTKHEIINGRAVDVRERARHHESQSTSRDVDNQEFVTSIHLPVPPSNLHTSQPSTPSPAFQPGTTPPNIQPESSQPSPLAPLLSYSPSSSPPTSTPSHGVEPINVSHRVRWSIFIRNLDGHTSELRCSLPVTILDTYFLNDALDYSSPSRRILFESSGIANDLVIPGSSHTSREGQERDQDLPSYRAHVRDRVPNLLAPWTPGVGTPSSGVFLRVRIANFSLHQGQVGVLLQESRPIPLSLPSQCHNYPTSLQLDEVRHWIGSTRNWQD